MSTPRSCRWRGERTEGRAKRKLLAGITKSESGMTESRFLIYELIAESV